MHTGPPGDHRRRSLSRARRRRQRTRRPRLRRGLPASRAPTDMRRPQRLPTHSAPATSSPTQRPASTRWSTTVMRGWASTATPPSNSAPTRRTAGCSVAPSCSPKASTGADALAAGWWTSFWQVPVLLHDGSSTLPRDCNAPEHARRRQRDRTRRACPDPRSRSSPRSATSPAPTSPDSPAATGTPPASRWQGLRWLVLERPGRRVLGIPRVHGSVVRDGVTGRGWPDALGCRPLVRGGERRRRGHASARPSARPAHRWTTGQSPRRRPARRTTPSRFSSFLPARPRCPHRFASS